MISRAIVLPGMGADSTMYGDAQWRRLPNARFVDWPEHHGEKSIAAIAGRIVEANGIEDGEIVIGSSLGGIIACEIARLRDLRVLVLIGSAISPREISGLLALLHPLVSLAPVEFIQRAAGKAPGELAQMFAQSQAAFIRAACAAIFDWPGLDTTRIKPLRIHGTRDRVVPMPREVDLRVAGGHLIAMSHPKECTAFLEARIGLQSRC
mgnify:CR=1 FL=1